LHDGGDKTGLKKNIFKSPTRWVLLGSGVLLGFGFGVKLGFVERPNLMCSGISMGFQLLE